LKISVPTYLVPAENPFKPSEISISQRMFRQRDFAHSLINLIIETKEPLVLAIDEPWGEGKTTFVKSWAILLEDEDISCIYFDAFESDYLDDPFSAIAGEVYTLVKRIQPTEANRFSDKAVKAAKIVGRAGIRVATKIAIGTALDGGLFESSGTVKDVSKEASEIIDKAIETAIRGREQERKDLESFRVFLREMIVSVCNGKPTVLIIDELDRCKPTFALSLLEVVKHLFSVQGLVFVLVTNRLQLEESIRAAYGSGIDAPKYLQKFVSLWVNLPKSKNASVRDKENYAKYCLNRMEFDGSEQQISAVTRVFREFGPDFKLSLREIEQILTNFSIVYNSKGKDINDTYLMLVSFLSTLKVVNPSLYLRVSNESITHQELYVVTGLDRYKQSNWSRPEGSYLKWFIRYSMDTDSGRNDLIKETGQSFVDSFDFYPVALSEICQWLDMYSA